MSITLSIIKMQMKKQGPTLDLSLNADFEKQRAIMSDPKNQMPPQKGVSFEAAEVCGVPVEISRPKIRRNDNIILYIHGGGFAFGDEVSSRAYASVLAGNCEMMVYSVGYRLAPEHRFPAGAEDCYAVYQELTQKYPNSKIALVGESAGGNLALTTALMAKDKGTKMPCCIYAISPCCTLAEELPSRKENRSVDLVLPHENLGRSLVELYLTEDMDPYNPYVSPMYGDYEGFPPVMLSVDNSEVLRDEVKRTKENMEKAGVSVEYHELMDTFHSFPTLGGICPEGKKILTDTVLFLMKYC